MEQHGRGSVRKLIIRGRTGRNCSCYFHLIVRMREIEFIMGFSVFDMISLVLRFCKKICFDGCIST